MGEMKLATTYEQQIELLKSRGLIIEDEAFAKSVLSRLNYYSLTGYLHDFKASPEKYVCGLTFEKIYHIYEFDKRFRNLLLYIIETIEHTLKTKISYNIAHAYPQNPYSYLDANNFRDKKEHDIFICKLNEAIRTNDNIPFVKHHLKKYDGKFPIWVAIELCTMGMLFNFYKNLPTENQKAISREFNTGPVQLSSWIDNIKYTRNLLAHYMRIYNFKLQKTPVHCYKNHKYKITSYKIFDIVYVMKFMFHNKEEWNNYVLPNFRHLIDEYSTYICLDGIGFPEEWEKILTK